MSGITIQFTPWSPFYARKRSDAIQRWLDEVGKASVRIFKASASGGYPPASAPGAWPHRRSGTLLGTINYEVGGMQVTVGSNAYRGGAPYSLYLREGTSRMARRKMSDDALKAGMKSAHLGRWVEWSR
jgi:hypothetical protein